MRKVRASDAEGQFGTLLKDVERGETIEIVRDGAVVAQVVPAGASLASRRRTPEQQARVEQAIATIKAIRERAQPVTAEEIREWINEGRE
jgi:antitoxin (DNA-binding transcriptional repressor) of toxin-antitoxin stability system